MKTTTSILFVLLFSFGALAQQNIAEYKKQYNQAVQLYANSQYDNATAAFLPLTQEKFDHALAPYSHYYAALCANNLTNFTQSKTLLRQLFQRFPDWPKMDEAYYLYAEASFNQNNYEEAMTYLDRIQDAGIRKSMLDMEYKYLVLLTDFTAIKELQRKFPNNPTLAELYVKAVQEKPYVTREELELSDKLTNQFNLIARKKGGFSRAHDDQSIDFGILLPFNIEEMNTAAATHKPYPYDIYIGLKIAARKLANEGIATNIYAFDIGKDADQMGNLVQDRNFKRVDLFVGPLYPSPNKIATDYAVKNKVLQVHPLSNNEKLAQENEGVFLALPSFKDQSKKAVTFAKELNTKRSVAIYYGKSSKDEQFAAIYKAQAEKEGLNVIEFKQVNTPQDIKNQVVTNHVFLATMPSETRALIQQIRKSKNNAPIFSAAASFDFSSFPMNMLADNVYLIYPEYIDFESSDVQDFKDIYVAMMGELPSYFAYLGHDIGLYYARILKDGKSEIEEKMNMIQYTNGYTLSGFDYTGNNKSNQLIPIVTYQYGKFRELTR